MLKYTITNLDTNESYYPILNNESELGALIATNKVLYGENYEVSFVDITVQHEKELEDKQLDKKKEFASQIIRSVIAIIKDWTIQDKIITMARSDVQSVMSFLSYGSLDQSKTLCEGLAVDTLLTQEIKTEILSTIQAKINEYNSIAW